MSSLTDCLCCPRCGTPLELFTCRACAVDFPVYDEVPWLVADPDVTRFEWRSRWQLALAELESRQRAAREGAARVTGAATLARLTNLADGYARQHRLMKELLKSLGLARPANLETYLALKTRLPSAMSLTGYQANVFRDWCWGDAENAAALSLVSGILGDRPPESILVLGAGAGRLAYDLHQHLGSGLTVALELNPFLTTVLRQIASGAVIDLVEFPLAPKQGDRSAIDRSLQAPAAARAGFEVVLADALRPPFRPASFDLVVTPWLLDVIGADSSRLIRQINGLLKPEGRWVYHGSVAFNHADIVENLSLEELEAQTVDCGFTVLGTSEQAVPYLDCPDSRHGRREVVVTLCAGKSAEAESPSRHQNLPDWIARGREAVPLLPAFQSQAMATRIHAFIMSLIDGRRSLKDMAALMEEQQLMSREEAETAIRGFLIKMLDEAESPRGYQ